MRRGPLTVAAVVLVVTMLVHAADHYRQDRSLAAEVYYGGWALLIAAVIMLGLVVTGHRWAPLVAAGLGVWITIGVTASHFVPHWSAFSDPYADLGLDAASWAAALAEVVAAAALAAVALRGHILARR